MTTRRSVLTKARQRFISSLAKNLIVVLVAAAFGGEYLFRLSGTSRVAFFVTVGVIVLVLFVVGVWLAVEEDDTEE